MSDGEGMPTEREWLEGLAHPPCIPRCDLSAWPDKALIVGICPRCTRTAEASQTTRVLRARELTKDALTQESPDEC